MDVEKEKALERVRFQFSSIAARELKDYSEKTNLRKRNINHFIVFLRKKMTTSIVEEEL